MLSLPSPSDGQDLYDGVPMVELAADPCNMEIFLNFFYQPGYVGGPSLILCLNSYLDRNNYLSYEDSDIAFKMYGVLKLADMFDVEPLQQRILARIRQDWLTVKSAEDWMKKQSFYSSFKPKQIKNVDGYRLEPASVLRVARQFDPSLITPLLFHYLSFHDPDAVHGQNPAGINGNLRYIPAARWELVSPADRALAGIGRQAVLHWMDKALLSLQGAVACSNGDNLCEREMKKLVTLSIRHKMYYRSSPMAALTGSMLKGRRSGFDPEEEAGQDVFCTTCSREWDRKLIELREELFSELSNLYRNIHPPS